MIESRLEICREVPTTMEGQYPVASISSISKLQVVQKGKVVSCRSDVNVAAFDVLRLQPWETGNGLIGSGGDDVTLVPSPNCNKSSSKGIGVHCL